VFVYVGALHGIFAGVRRVLRSGGRFVFSVEEIQPGEEGATQVAAPEGTGLTAPASGERSDKPSLKRPGVLLRSTMRYAHSESYVRDQAQQAGFGLLELQRSTLRHHQGQPVVGLCVLLELQ
jgi:predicted TPR repeat methyltransferase